MLEHGKVIISESEVMKNLYNEWLDKDSSRVGVVEFVWDFELMRFYYPEAAFLLIKDTWRLNNYSRSNSFEFALYNKLEDYFGKKRNVSSLNSPYNKYRFYDFSEYDLDKCIPHFIDLQRYSYIPMDEYLQSDFERYFSEVKKDSGSYVMMMKFWKFIIYDIIDSERYINYGFNRRVESYTSRQIANREKSIKNILINNSAEAAISYFDKFINKIRKQKRKHYEQT